MEGWHFDERQQVWFSCEESETGDCNHDVGEEESNARQKRVSVEGDVNGVSTVWTT